jgi:hypothetical protein
MAARPSPGPAADRAFRLGIIAAVIIGAVGLGLLYRLTDTAAILVGYAAVALFPLYLVGAAAVLSVWLGYDKDATALRPVYRDRESE